MITTKTVTRSEKLQEAIDRVLDDMVGIETTDEKYATLADQLTTLYKALATDVELQIKENDSLTKQEDAQAALDQKKAEHTATIGLKKLELEQNHAFKLVEQTANNELKHAELALKEAETTASLKLKAVETIAKQDDIERRNRVSMDTLAVIGANLAGIVAILAYERAHIITSKALGFVTKSR